MTNWHEKNQKQRIKNNLQAALFLAIIFSIIALLDYFEFIEFFK